MKREIEKRLDEIEGRKFDWAGQLEIVDYGVLDNYPSDEWEELHSDKTLTVVRHRTTGEIRGYYLDRRTDAEIESEGGNLEYL